MDNWRQHHSNILNQGVMPVQTSVITQPKWTVDVGKTACVAPVISHDGTVYVGNLQGELVAIHPNGTLKWKKSVTTSHNPDYPGMITATPAVGNDHNIYVITTVNAVLENRRNQDVKSVHVRRSSLHSFTPSGSKRWSFRFPAPYTNDGLGAYTTSSPRVWGNENIFIFIQALNISQSHIVELLVINQYGNLINKIGVSSSHLSKHLDDISIWHYLEKTDEFHDILKESNLSRITDWPEPMMVLADFEPYDKQPLLVMQNQLDLLVAYRWHYPVLVDVWKNLSENHYLSTSPVIYHHDNIICGNRNGTLVSYGLENGKVIGNVWQQPNHPIIGSPVCFDNHIYVIAGDQLFMLDHHLQTKAQYALTGKTLGSLSLSANHVYLSTSDGYYIFSLDLKLMGKNNHFIGGCSTPAISADGRVYVLDQLGKLWMFGE